MTNDSPSPAVRPGAEEPRTETMTRELAEALIDEKASVAYYETKLAESEAEVSRLTAERDAARDAALGMVRMYSQLVNSGDAGFWDPEEVEEVKAVRAAFGGGSPTGERR